jgi:DNA-binding NarL/FixJ family response regulator
MTAVGPRNLQGVPLERTIKGVIHEITTRLNLRNRSHAVAYAIKTGAL